MNARTAARGRAAILALVGGLSLALAGATIPASAAAPDRSSVLAPTLSVVRTDDLAYESSASPILVPGTLDVYAPTVAGPWPVVVMFHGAPGEDPVMDRDGLAEHARLVAGLGFVVFNASWGQAPEGSASGLTYDGTLAVNSQAACAVEFARAHAAEYGGDPATLIVFGHSAGAQTGAMVTFARPGPSAGCLAGSTLGDIDALVTWEGNWLLSMVHPIVMDLDGVLAADPRIMDALTPWTSLAGHNDQKVVMLVSEDPSTSLLHELPGVIVDRPVGDPGRPTPGSPCATPRGSCAGSSRRTGPSPMASSPSPRCSSCSPRSSRHRATPSRSMSCRTLPTRTCSAPAGRSSWPPSRRRQHGTDPRGVRTVKVAWEDVGPVPRGAGHGPTSSSPRLWEPRSRPPPTTADTMVDLEQFSLDPVPRCASAGERLATRQPATCPDAASALP